MYDWNIVPALVSEILLIMLLLYLYTDRRGVLSAREKLFYYCVLIAFIGNNINMFSVISIRRVSSISLALNHVVQMADFILGGLLCCLFFIYLSLILYEAESDITYLRRTMLWFIISTGIFLAIVLVNPLTGWIFSFSDAEHYVRGPLNKLILLLYLFHVMVMLVALLRRRDIAPRELYKTALIGVTGALLAFMLQLYYPDLMMSGFAATCALLVVFIGTQQSRIGTDALTGVYDWTALHYSIDHALRNHRRFRLFVVELRGFKEINNRFGQTNGSLFLKAIARRLWSEAPHGVFRMIGAKFTLMLYDKPNSNRPFMTSVPANETPQEALSFMQVVCERVMGLFNRSWNVSGMVSQVDASFVSIDENIIAGSNANQLISYLEHAMILLKDDPDRNLLVFDESFLTTYKRRQHLINITKQRLAENAFRICYQPIFNVNENRFVGAEALIRMNDIDGTPISPGEFIPLAEQIGLTADIDRVVTEKICKMLSAHVFPDDWYISINISMHQFVKNDFAERYLSLLEQHRIDPKRVKLEITEYTLMTNEEATIANMHLFTNSGIGILLDDYGIGYCNLFALSHLPFECVKFDMSLISNIENDKTTYMMLKAFIDGIRKTGIRTLLEGVETEQQKNILLTLGVNLMQGYYYARPMEEDVFIRHHSIASNRRSTPPR